MNTSLGEIGVSPLKLHSLSSGSKVKEGKRKLQRIEDKQLETTETVRKKIAKVLDVQESKLTSFNKAAEYEVWHQRLGHCSNDILLTMHQHARGIPKLTGRNGFY